jgi:hypothetical protein
MEKSNIIKELQRQRALYLAEAKGSKQPEYWEGKASGLLLAIETIQAIAE